MNAADSKFVLVAGGAGYIGSHTSKQLARQGYTPIVLDDLSAGHQWAANYGPFYQGNIANAELLAKIHAEHPFDSVIVFAGSIFVGESVTEPRKYFQNNVVNLTKLVGNLLDLDVKKLVFSSSCAVYGTPEQLPLLESEKKLPLSPYGETKLIGERMLQAYSRAYGLKAVMLRYFNAAGADFDLEIGEAHDPETHLIPLIIEAALGTRDKIGVFGQDYATPDGTAVRDYIHVNDLATAHIKAVEYLQAGGETIALNVGTGHGYSVLEVIKAVEKVHGAPIKVEHHPRREGDPHSLYADPALANSTLGWVPVDSDLERIVNSAYAWHKQQLTNPKSD